MARVLNFHYMIIIVIRHDIRILVKCRGLTPPLFLMKRPQVKSTTYEKVMLVCFDSLQEIE